MIEKRKNPKNRGEEAASVLRDTFDRLYKVSLCLATLQHEDGALDKLVCILNPDAGIRSAVLLQKRCKIEEFMWRSPDVSDHELTTARITASNCLAYFSADAAAGSCAPGQGNDTSVIIPLVVGGGGIFGVLHLECTAVDESSVTFLHAVGHQFAIALDRLYQLEQQKQHRSSLRSAAAANQAKSDFLANISHEIRTPLGIILGFADLALRGGCNDADRVDALAIIKRNGSQLAQLVDELLDLSKIEAGRLEVDRVPTDLASVLDEVTAGMTLNAREKGIFLTMETVDPLPQRLFTDPYRLRQCLTNVIGNAIKFTEKGGVQVKISAQDDQLKFAVKDTGIGLSAQHQLKLFEPFTQADPSTTRKFGGTGLGLVLSRKLARALGGDLYLEYSAVGGGSCFVLLVAMDAPNRVAVKTAPELTKPLAKNVRLAGLSVLLVEDTPDNQLLVRTYLELAGASVGLAGNGEDGVRKALAGAYDLVLMDIQMPGIDGYEATSRLRQSGYQTPVVALTANAMRGDREKSLSAGFTDYLSKPIDRELLLTVVQKATRCGVLH